MPNSPYRTAVPIPRSARLNSSCTMIFERNSIPDPPYFWGSEARENPTRRLSLRCPTESSLLRVHRTPVPPGAVSSSGNSWTALRTAKGSAESVPATAGGFCPSSFITVPLPFRFGRHSVTTQVAENPPSTERTCPLTKLACSPAKNRTTSATSRGVPTRFCGVRPVA